MAQLKREYMAYVIYYLTNKYFTLSETEQDTSVSHLFQKLLPIDKHILMA